MMRWQKIARFAIAVFVLGFAAFVFLAMRQRVAAPSDGGNVANVDPQLVVKSGTGNRKNYKFGKLKSPPQVQEAAHIQGRPDEVRRRHLGVSGPERPHIRRHGDEAEAITPPDKATEPNGARSMAT